MQLRNLARPVFGLGASLALILGLLAGPAAAVTPTPVVKVLAVATETSLKVSPNPAAFGAPLALTSKVTLARTPAGALPVEPTPTGTMQVIVDGKPVGSPLPVASGASTPASSDFSINCTITINPWSINCTINWSFAKLAPLSVGAHAVRVVYSGDDYYVSSSSPVMVERITRVSTRLAVRADPNPVGRGAALALVAHLTPSSEVAGFTPGGTFSVLLDGKVIGGPLPVKAGTTTFSRAGWGINCVITFNPFSITCTITFGTARTTALSLGSHRLAIQYSGDTRYLGAKSSTLVVKVVKEPTRTGLTISPNPAAAGASWSLAGSLTPKARSGVHTPGGTFTVWLDGKPLGKPLPIKPGTVTTTAGDFTINCTITLSPFSINCTITLSMARTAVSAGEHQVQLAYSGDAYYASSKSPRVTEAVTAAK